MRSCTFYCIFIYSKILKLKPFQRIKETFYCENIYNIFILFLFKFPLASHAKLGYDKDIGNQERGFKNEY